ncbi:hypothetical protein FRC10_007332, partial [Ceratobasidium sp. 414]
PQARRTEPSTQAAKSNRAKAITRDVSMSDPKASPLRAHQVTAQSTPAPAIRERPAGGDGGAETGQRGASQHGSEGAVAGSANGSMVRPRPVVTANSAASRLSEQGARLLDFALTQASMREPGHSRAAPGKQGASGSDTNSHNGGEPMQTGEGASLGGRTGRGTKRSRANKGSGDTAAAESSKKAK